MARRIRTSFVLFCYESGYSCIVSRQKVEASSHTRCVSRREMRIFGKSHVYLLVRGKARRDFSTARGKTAMRMTAEAFQAWSQRLQFTSETERSVTYLG